MSSVITTDFERWKAQEAALGKPVALNEFVFANVPGLDPSKDISRDEKLPPAGQIVHRQAINKAGLASENAVAYSVTLGTDAGDFVFNWIGLINKESGTLAMITHAPEQRKIKTVDGVQGNVLTRSFLLEFNGAAKETQIITSAETWQIDFTARLAGMDEIQRLANRDIYGAAAFFGDGFLVTKAAEQYRVTTGTAYIEGLRGTLEEITTFNNLRDTKIYADFTFQGNLVSKWQTFVKVTTAKTLAHYQDAAGFQHYVAVIAEIDKNGNITDKRVKGTAIDRELAELKKDIPEKYQPIGNYQPAGDYQPAGSYVTTANFSLELNKKIDKASISDLMGNDGSKVPSLKLLSEQIGKCQPKGNYRDSSDLDFRTVSATGVQSWGLFNALRVYGSDDNLWAKNNAHFGIADNKLLFIGMNVDGVEKYINFRHESGVSALTKEVIGVDQDLYDMTSSRVVNGEYINQTTKPIFVYINTEGNVSTGTMTTLISKDGKKWATVGGGSGGGVGLTTSFIVPSGWKYKTTSAFSRWTEIR